MTAAKVQAEAPRATRAPAQTRAWTQQEILDGVLRGNSAANAALYDTLRPVVVRSLARVLRDRRVDDDLVQTCFERIVSTLVRKQGQVSNLSAWAGAISANVAVDALRARIRERELFEPQLGPKDLAPKAPAQAFPLEPEQEVEARSRLQWVQSVLAKMKPKQAQTLLLHDVFGHDLEEVAQLTGVTPSAAQRRLSRARHELLRRAGSKVKADTQTGGQP